MAVPLKVWVTFTVTFTFSVVYSPPTFRDLHPSKTTSVAVLNVDENYLLNLLRKRRETIVGHGCPKGKIRYYTKCKSSKELEYDDIPSTTGSGKVHTMKVTLEEDKHVESMETDVILSVMPLAISGVTTKLSTVMNEPRVSVTIPTPIVTEPNFNVKPLETVQMPPATSGVTTKLTTVMNEPRVSVTIPKPIVTEPNFNVIPLETVQMPHATSGVTTKLSTVMNKLRVSVTIPTPIVTQPNFNVKPLETVQKPRLPDTESNSIFTTLRTKVVTPNPNVTDPRSVMATTNKVGTELSSVMTESVPAVAKQKTPVTSIKTFMTDPKPAMSTTAAADVTLSTTISTPVVVGTSPATTKTKGIETDSSYLTTDSTPTVAETSPARTETNLDSVPETISLPTRITVTESVSSTTTVKSKEMFGTHILNTFISALKEWITWKYTLLLVGGSVVYYMYYCTEN